MTRKLYRRGGKLYCMQNGALVPYVHKAQQGTYTVPVSFQFESAPNVDINQISREEFGPKGNRKFSTYDNNGNPVTNGNPNAQPFNWNNWANATNIGSAFAMGMMNNYAPTRDTGKYSSDVNKFNNNASFDQGISTAANAIPGYGQIINAFKAIGTGVSKAVKNKDQYGISQSAGQEAIGNIIHPGEWIQQSINIGKKYGDAAGVKNFFTAGISGRNLMKEAKDLAIDRQDFENSRSNIGRSRGNYRNDSVYAKKGTEITTSPFRSRINPNVEIEDGEIILGDPSQISYTGNANPSMISPFAVKFNGDKHGQDTDNDQMEGIPLQAQQGTYVASNYLGLDGKKAGKGQKTVAQEMEPIVNALSKAEQDPQDLYKSNPHVIEHHLRMLSAMKNQAEQGKFMEELNTILKSKDRNLDDALEYIAQELPVRDMTPEQLAKVAEISNKLQQDQSMNMDMENQMQMGGYNYLNKFSKKEIRQRAKENKKMFPMVTPKSNQINIKGPTSKMQEGGQMQPNESNQHAQMLANQATNQMSYNNPAQGDLSNLDPQVQEMFDQLPPEMQEQVMSLPIEQREMAIMVMFQQLEQGQMEEAQQMEPEMTEQNGAAEGVNEMMVQMLGGYNNNYQGDKFREEYQDGGTMGNDLFMSNPMEMNMRSAHLPRPKYKSNFNKAMGNHTAPETFHDFNQHQMGGMIDPVEKLVNHYKNRGYLEDTAREMAKNKMNEFQPNGMLYGEMVKRNIQPGMKIRFKKGGRVHYGTVTDYDAKTGHFNIV